jgi:hypothetical protein
MSKKALGFRVPPEASLARANECNIEAFSKIMALASATFVVSNRRRSPVSVGSLAHTNP